MAEVCSNCGGSFASVAELATHINETHAGGSATETLESNPAATTPGFKCGLCGKTFSTPPQLASHNLQPHPEPGRLAAPPTA
ncbi:MAG: C2H2-type zinc finger protein [Thermoplasmata archaeon]